MQLGRYNLEEVIGEGEFGQVWRGTLTGEMGFSRPVAIKELHEGLEFDGLALLLFECAPESDPSGSSSAGSSDREFIRSCGDEAGATGDTGEPEDREYPRDC